MPKRVSNTEKIQTYCAIMARCYISVMRSRYFYDATRYTRAETNIVLTRNMPNWAHIVQSRSPPLEISTLIFEIGEIGL